MTNKDKERIMSALAIKLKGKMSVDEIGQLVDDVQQMDSGQPWWHILLKVLAYAIGLILAGYGTTAAAMTITHIL